MSGEEPERAGAGAGPRAGKDDRRVVVDLEGGRGAHLLWTGIGLLLGGFLLWKLGVVGKWVGGFLVVVGIYNAYGLIRGLLHPPGRIEISGDEVVLPEGLCRPGKVSLAVGDVTHAYFLRRSVPWLMHGPLLVIEARDRAHVFPRDWFASDADQRRIAHALNKRLGRLP